MTTVGELASRLGGDVEGDRQLVLLGAQALEKAGAEDVTFVADEQNLRRLAGCRAGAVIIPRHLADSIPAKFRPAVLILVDNARHAFLQALTTLRTHRAKTIVGISPQAHISPSAKIGGNANIHPGVTIGDDVIIGDNCELHPGVCIAPGCQLGNDVTIHSNAVLYTDVLVADRVIIHAGAVIGADGFGYRLEDGRHERIPHFGTVRIESDVEVGACSTIDRAMIGETVIGEGTKIDNLVMIAHNCEVGPHNIFASQVGFAGSVTTGAYVVCAGQVGVADHVVLGEGCRLGAKAGVHKNLPAGGTFIGAPASPVEDARRILMAQQRLPDMRKQVRELEKLVAALSSRLEDLEKPGHGNVRVAA